MTIRLAYAIKPMAGRKAQAETSPHYRTTTCITDLKASELICERYGTAFEPTYCRFEVITSM